MCSENFPMKGIRWYLGYDYAVWGSVQLDYMVTRSLCRYLYFSSECSSQMGSEQAGDYPSSSRNSDSSTMKGNGDTMTQSPRFRFCSAATRLAHDTYFDTYVRWSHNFIFVWGIRLVSVIMVCITFFFHLISSWGNFPLQSYWGLSCDHGLRYSDELIWEK